MRDFVIKQDYNSSGEKRWIEEALHRWCAGRFVCDRLEEV
jgi:hypothetical protein